MPNNLRHFRDHYLPPDRSAFLAAEPATGRVIVIAPTRAACETIELAVGLRIATVLEREHGEEIRVLAREGKGFGIVAGTGTGKTLSVRPIAEEILRAPLKVGVVNREREATPETPSWNVVIVTTGIARRWFQDGDILPQDTLVVDEIHQTSAELELCLALGKRVGCRFIWLSATVDPTFYARYLASDSIIESYAFDPAKAATVKVVSKEPLEFLDERFLKQIFRERRGVGVFLPTRAGVEEVATDVGHRFPRINTAFYHGGEPIRVIRPFLEGDAPKPYLLAMTAAGQSALNVQGLDTVVIDDVRFTNIIERGKNVLTKSHLGANEILQMAGRVHGRVARGRVFILSDRDIEFAALRPTSPEFQLAGDSERVAITCADLGVRADELDLPVPLDRRAYRDAVRLLTERGIIDEHGKLTQYGKAVEAMPVDRPWAELLVHADDDLVPFISVMASVESLHRMTREDRNLEGLVVPGSDHLTSYNLYAEAYKTHGYIGQVYGLPRQLFDEDVLEWAEQRGALVKAIEDAALGMASIYRNLELPLPDEMPYADNRVLRKFQDLVAHIMPFDLVIDEVTATGEEARVSKTSVCQSWGPIAGELRYFADRYGTPRASIEGTELPYALIRKHATYEPGELVVDPRRKQAPLVLVRRVVYRGFELEKEVEPLVGEFPSDRLNEIRRALASSLARFEARHPAVKRNRPAIEELREVYRRSGGRTARLGERELAELYESRLGGVHSLDDFRAADLTIDPDALVPNEERAKMLALPDAVMIRDREVPIDYDVEADVGGVARLRLPEKIARNLHESELPRLDRPIRFTVTRGQRGSVRADSLDDLQAALVLPWTPGEAQAEDDARRDAREARRQARREARRGVRRDSRRDDRHGHFRTEADGQRRGGRPGRSRRRRTR
ncbi:MAG TPA: DEAD/DEAH box helicase [Gemmatimonadaceae bacterium]|nr:DEAD/DEAH box helicase [Gemmatimonadaceae bacterium]